MNVCFEIGGVDVMIKSFEYGLLLVGFLFFGSLV